MLLVLLLSFSFGKRGDEWLQIKLIKLIKFMVAD